MVKTPKHWISWPWTSSVHLLFCFPKIHLVRYSPVYYSLLQTAGFQNVFPQYPLVYQFLLFPFQLHAQHIFVTYLSNFIVYCWDPFSTINHYVHVGNVYLPRASPAIAAAAANPLKVWFFRYISGPCHWVVCLFVGPVSCNEIPTTASSVQLAFPQEDQPPLVVLLQNVFLFYELLCNIRTTNNILLKEKNIKRKTNPEFMLSDSV